MRVRPSRRSSTADPCAPSLLQELRQLRGRLEGRESALAKLRGEHQALQEEHQRIRAAASQQGEGGPRAAERQEEATRLQQELATQQDRAVALQEVCPLLLGAAAWPALVPLTGASIMPVLISSCSLADGVD